MKYPFLHMVGRIGWAVVLGSACLAGTAAAQQFAPRNAPASQADQQGDSIPLGWVKLCRVFTAVTTTKDRKEESKDLNICLTKNETVYVNSGKMRSSAAIRQVDGDPKQRLMVTVPLEMDLRPGMRATVYPKDIWQKWQRGEQTSKADEAKLKPLTLVYTQCNPIGCDSELDVTQQLINDLTAGGALMLFAFNTAGVPVPFPVPLAGFDKAYANPPMDDQSYNEARRKVMQQIEQQQEIKGTIVVPKQLRP